MLEDFKPFLKRAVGVAKYRLPLGQELRTVGDRQWLLLQPVKFQPRGR
jgi:hypothetical protein